MSATPVRRTASCSVRCEPTGRATDRILLRTLPTESDEIPMSYLFLSGATGLLGAYLVRDLTLAGVNLALLVRSTRMESARQRVEGLMARWEKEAGFALPRPVILEGDLKRGDLGLSEAATDWARQHCRAFMHNAASLTFYGNGRNEEPYLSNINGTRNVLEFCEGAGIREFHHVSTAYVCGKRRGVILESELDAGQELGNDYEISKFESEQMVRSAGFLNELTVYRPGIIVGDAQTGYTTTFHGFYVPLKLVSTLMAKTGAVGVTREELEVAVRFAGSQLMTQILNTQGNERKNLVPVDWVAAVMSYVYCNRQHHGKTYHLTPPQPVPVAVMQRAIEDSFIQYTSLTSKASQTAIDWEKFGDYFYEQMLVYRSYWGDDPVFDSTNTQTAAPHLPCPPVDAELLQRQCKFAIESNFGWPKPRPAVVNDEVLTRLQPLLAAGVAARQSPAGTLQVGLVVNGNGGGRWELTVRDGVAVAAVEGVSENCPATCCLNSATFHELVSGKKTVQQCLDCGYIHIEAIGELLPQIVQTLQGIVSGGASGRVGPAEPVSCGDAGNK